MVTAKAGGLPPLHTMKEATFDAEWVGVTCDVGVTCAWCHEPFADGIREEQRSAASC
jgi:hypothetical protein